MRTGCRARASDKIDGMSRRDAESGRVVGRYVLGGELAAGGMATVFWGRLAGSAGFTRTVAVKRLHPQYAKDPEFAAMFLDEARLASRIRHGNVVATLDVVSDDGELFLVMEYVHGESLAKLLRAASERGERLPHDVAAAIVVGVLQGLDAAHEATSEDGAPLAVVHRDVSPQNVLVGADGIARVLDFGVAKAAWRAHTTRDGTVKGKLAYMAPEQLRGEPVDRRVDVFSSAILLWELLTGTRLFGGEEPQVYVQRILGGDVAPPSQSAPDVPPALDAVVMKGLALDRNERFATAREMARALEAACAPASARVVAEWVASVASVTLAERRELLAALERRATNAASIDEAQGDALAAVSARAARADERVARAALPTEPELSGVMAREASDRGDARTDRAASVAEPLPTSRRRRLLPAVMFVLVTAIVALGAFTMRRPPTTDVRPEALPPVSLRAPESAPKDDAVPDAAVSASSAAPLPSVVAIPASASAPSSAPIVRAPSPRPSRPAPRPPASSAKSGLCMKQRADGVVYFAPCP